MEPKTWTNEEILELMYQTALDYKSEASGTWTLKEMMECVLATLRENYLIEDTP